MTPLIEAIKNWRKAKEKRNDLTFTRAEWSLNPQFIGEPINSNTVRSIGDYVDDKLTEYSQQNNVNPVRNRLQGILRHNTVETDITDEHVASEAEDEHVASEAEDEHTSSIYYTGGHRLRNTYNEDLESDPSLDMITYTHGLIYDPRRMRDSFVRRNFQQQRMIDHLRENHNITNPERITHDGRNIHQVIRFCPPSTKPLASFAYVTNYTLDYEEMKIKARIIIAPKDKIISPSDWFNCCTNDQPKTLKDIIKKTIWENINVGVIHRSKIFHNLSSSEWQALETLREMITEKDFRKYLKQGFILVRGPSGLIYQVFRNNQHIKVWDKGNLIEEICVRIQSGDVPLTDNIIAFKTIIETDENEIHQLGNVYNMRKAA
jgi:hypothetical protein